MSKPKKAKRPESVTNFSALPYAVMDSPAYTGASVAAKALLNELIRQHNGANNGRLHLAHAWLAGRGWPSKSTVDKARAELLERGLVVQTRQGGMGIGATWFALTWLIISNFTGLDIGPKCYPQGAWKLCQLLPTSRRKAPMKCPACKLFHAAALVCPGCGYVYPNIPTAAVKKRAAQPVHRGGLAPYTGAIGQGIAPVYGAIKPVFSNRGAPVYGDDVSNQCPPLFPAMLASVWRLKPGQPTARPVPVISVFRRRRLGGLS